MEGGDEIKYPLPRDGYDEDEEKCIETLLLDSSSQEIWDEGSSRPLLGDERWNSQARDNEESRHYEKLHKCSFRGGVSNLVVTAVGAGMLAMPKALATGGIVIGIGIAGLAAFMTIFSAYIIVSFASNDGAKSYEELIRYSFGNRGASILSSSIIIHVFGVMIVYLMIIADQLVGKSPDYEGLLPSLLEKPGGKGWLSREAVTGCLILSVVAPLLISRSLAFLSRFSRASVGLLLALATLLLGLAGVALFEQKAATDIHVLPSSIQSWGELGNFFSSLLAVLAVSALAFTLHFNLIPIHRSLRDSREGTMHKATRYAVGIAGMLYITVGMAGYILYGSHADGDVLKNLTIRSVSRLIPSRIATPILAFIVCAMTINLLVNFVLKVWAVREALCELVLSRKSLELTKFAYYMLTGFIVGAAYVTSIFIPSVWLLVSLVGSTACVTFSYAFPGLILYQRAVSGYDKAAGLAAVILAIVMATTAIFNALTGRSDV